jgi:hypothetical protein
VQLPVDVAPPAGAPLQVRPVPVIRWSVVCGREGAQEVSASDLRPAPCVGGGRLGLPELGGGPRGLRRGRGRPPPPLTRFRARNPGSRVQGPGSRQFRILTPLARAK